MHYKLHTKNRLVVQLVSDLFVALSEHEYSLGYLSLKVYFANSAECTPPLHTLFLQHLLKNNMCIQAGIFQMATGFEVKF